MRSVRRTFDDAFSRRISNVQLWGLGQPTQLLYQLGSNAAPPSPWAFAPLGLGLPGYWLVTTRDISGLIVGGEGNRFVSIGARGARYRWNPLVYRREALARAPMQTPLRHPRGPSSAARIAAARAILGKKWRPRLTGSPQML